MTREIWEQLPPWPLSDMGETTAAYSLAAYEERFGTATPTDYDLFRGVSFPSGEPIVICVPRLKATHV